LEQWVVNKEVSLSAGLAVLHQKGIAHGDFYAHNIMLDTATGEVWPLTRNAESQTLNAT